MTQHRPRSSVLVVDNDRAFRETLAKLLMEERWEVTTASSAAESSEQFKAKRFDAAIIDVNLGTAPDGLELARELSRLEPRLRIFMMSGDPENEERVKMAGMGRFLRKPFRFSHLQAALAGDQR